MTSVLGTETNTCNDNIVIDSTVASQLTGYGSYDLAWAQYGLDCKTLETEWDCLSNPSPPLQPAAAAGTLQAFVRPPHTNTVGAITQCNRHNDAC